MCVRERDSAQREREQKSLAKGGRVAPGGSSPLLDLVSGWSPNSTSIKAESQSLERSARSNYREGARARGRAFLWRRSIAGVIYPYRESYLTFARLRFFDFRGIPTRTFVRNVGTCLHGTVAGSCQKNVYRLTLSDRRDGTGYGAIPTDATAAPAAAGASASACSSCIRTVRDHRVREPVLWLRVRQRGPWRAEPLHFASHTTAFRGPATAHIEQYSMRWLYIIINTHTGPTLLSRWHAHLDETRIHARRSLQGQGSCASVVPRLCLS